MRLVGLRGPLGSGKFDFAARWIRWQASEFGRRPFLVDARVPGVDLPGRPDPGEAACVLLPPEAAAEAALRALGGFVLGPRMLMLTRDEAVASLCPHATAPEAFAPVVDQARRYVGGWLHGLAFLTAPSALPMTERAEQLLPAVESAWLPWLLAQDEPELLLDAGFLPRLSPGLLTALTGNDDGPGLLDRAVRAGLAQEGRVPDLIQTAVIGQVRRTREPDAGLRFDAATRALASEAGPVEALRYAVTHRRWTAASDLARRAWPRLLNTDPQFLMETVRLVPERFAEAHRENVIGRILLDLLGPLRRDVPLQFVDVPEHPPGLEELRLTLRHSPRRDHVLTLNGLTLLTMYERTIGLYDDAAKTARRSLALASTLPGGDQGSDLSVAALHAGLSLLLIDDAERALEAFELAWHHSGVRKNPYSASEAAATAALVQAERGGRDAALGWLERFEHVAALECWNIPRARDKANVARALLALDELDRTATAEHLERLRHQPEIAELWPFSVLARVRLQRLQGHPSLAGETLSAVVRQRRRQATAPLSRRALAVLRAEALLAGDRPHEARDFVRSTMEGMPEAIVCDAWLAVAFDDKRLLASALRHVDDPTLAPRLQRLLTGIAVAMRNSPVEIEAVVRDHVAAGLPLLGLVPYWRSTAARDLIRDQGLLPPAWEVRLDGLAMTEQDPGERRPSLTVREREILSALADGKSRPQVAQELFVSTNTIKTQTSALYAKLGVSTREDAVREGGRWGYL
ncbi:LuxR C-terminal-related transcriptional regulator [Zhihengliuella sp.]|uniref:helix-turn-helix transcriptional regulator n=1 Tax=Zhihengliuella sp. TaxID=1954483 RepID=UPI002811653C|nr:LuxR C-terminal-related transcriptional regulator [Zhihengliuella sp.]